MARPRTPTKVLALKGAFKEHPKRLRERDGEPHVDAPLGEPPTCLDEAERARWHEMAAMCPWLTFSHRGVVELHCKLWMLERHGKAGPGDKKLLLSSWRVLGATPSDSSRVKAPQKSGTTNPFAAVGA